MAMYLCPRKRGSIRNTVPVSSSPVERWAVCHHDQRLPIKIRKEICPSSPNSANNGTQFCAGIAFYQAFISPKKDSFWATPAQRQCRYVFLLKYNSNLVSCIKANNKFPVSMQTECRPGCPSFLFFFWKTYQKKIDMKIFTQLLFRPLLAKLVALSIAVLK